MADKIVDARGLACPLPVVNAKQASEQMKEGEQLTVIVDNEVAVQNLQRFAGYRGFPAESEKSGENEYHVNIQITASSNVIEEKEEERKKKLVQS